MTLSDEQTHCDDSTASYPEYTFVGRSLELPQSLQLPQSILCSMLSFAELPLNEDGTIAPLARSFIESWFERAASPDCPTPFSLQMLSTDELDVFIEFCDSHGCCAMTNEAWKEMVIRLSDRMTVSQWCSLNGMIPSEFTVEELEHITSDNPWIQEH